MLSGSPVILQVPTHPIKLVTILLQMKMELDLAEKQLAAVQEQLQQQQGSPMQKRAMENGTIGSTAELEGKPREAEAQVAILVEKVSRRLPGLCVQAWLSCRKGFVVSIVVVMAGSLLWRAAMKYYCHVDGELCPSTRAKLVFSIWSA